jgi:hypothetical protein
MARARGKGVARQKRLLPLHAPPQAKPRGKTDTSCSRRAPQTTPPRTWKKSQGFVFVVLVVCKRTGCEFWKTLALLEVTGENRESCSLCSKGMRATHHGDQAHSWSTLCDEIPRVFLTALPAYGPLAFPRGPGEKHLWAGKLATNEGRDGNLEKIDRGSLPAMTEGGHPARQTRPESSVCMADS